MIRLVCLSSVLLFALPAWTQVEPSASGGDVTPGQSEQMLIPPPISVTSYPTEVGSEMRKNYLSAGVNFTSAYNDNVVPGYSPVPVSDFTYFVWPTISLHQQVARHTLSVTYTPGFEFYQKTSALNAVNQNADAGFKYRMSSRATFNLHELFQQNSNAFAQPFAVSGVVSGSIQAPSSFVIAPYANQLMNTVAAELSYQFGLNGMIGGGGSHSVLNYPNLSQVPGLFNSTSEGGMAFYNRRLSGSQYAGGIYQYSRIGTSPTSSTTQTHLFSVFYTLYLHQNLTVSLVAGPQYYQFAQVPTPGSNGWSPAIAASLGWQKSHVNIAASYSRSVNAGGGLLGVYNMNNANGQAMWQFRPSWTLGLQGIYTIVKNATPLSESSYAGGHTVMGDASVERRFGDRLRVQAGYDRLHQSYGGIALVNNAPDSNREFISISYQFTRLLGR